MAAKPFLALDSACFAGGLLQLIGRQETRFSSSIANDDAPLLGRLDIRFEVASNPVSDRDEGKLNVVKDIAVLASQFQQTLRETIVVLLLLDSVVKSRMAQVFLSIGNEEGF